MSPNKIRPDFLSMEAMLSAVSLEP
jgi:hypothetical protein